MKKKIFKNNKELIKFLKIIRNESKINTVGFYDLHDICGKNNIKELKQKGTIKNEIKKLGYKASETHFKGEGIRSGIPLKDLIKILKNRIITL